MLPLQGIAQGAQPITSYNYGANNTERVKKTFRVLLTVSLIYSVTLWLAVMLLPQFFVSIFTPETAMIEFASKALRIYMAVMFLFGIQIACQMTFYSSWQCDKFYHCGSYKKIYSAVTIDLYYAAYGFRQKPWVFTLQSR